ncbi:MAG: 23S rRNA (adenine(2503)-C(2))-methyltransferase RlmN [Ignavibacteriales bacterium]|nr:23S rRNA (adenine(2503)-C(2))-methyltransferase RlmN [Ignavibacteriales bacterium]
MRKKEQIKGLTLPELQGLFVTNGHEKFRATQVFNWMYNHKVLSFTDMNNISKDLRATLDEQYSLITLEKVKEQSSLQNGTKKFLFKTQDGFVIESVIIPDNDRTTLCLSTQVGCPLDCKFCATGVMGYKKNLTAGEIFDQYLLAGVNYERPISNVVYMGMGEPLLNYEATVRSLSIFGEELTKGISLKKITVSTAGIAHKIKELADTGLKCKLAFSLHSCFEDTRSLIMPINKKYSLKENVKELRYFAQKTDTRITFEYVMLQGINDRKEDVQAIIKLCRSMPSKVNIIPFNSLAHMNPTGLSAELVPTSKKKIDEFADELRNANLTVMLRDTKGEDIAAACGQLAITGTEV